MTLEAEYANRLVDIIHEGFDVVIRIGALEDPSAIYGNTT